jgi:hypothetical protein
MGKRAGRVTLDKLKFNFLPEKLAQVSFDSSEEIRQAYAECYRIIFRQEFELDNICSREDVIPVIISSCTKLSCPVKLFILTVMFGHREANPHARFWSSMLTGEAAQRRLLRYRQAVENQYGSFNTDSFDLYANDKLADELIEKQLKKSEVDAGIWIVGYKAKKAGDCTDNFYLANEIKLSEIWLATEPSYASYLIKPGTVEQNKKRIHVAKLVGNLKKNSKKAIVLFKAREKLMPTVVRDVLGYHNFSPTDFEILCKPCTDAINLWAKVGLAIQQVNCWKALTGNKVLGTSMGMEEDHEI